MQSLENPMEIRDKIVQMLTENDLAEPALIGMLDYTVQLFESQGLGQDYYGYHNINHELAVTYVILLSASSRLGNAKLSKSDIKHLYTAALFHDFDPLKSVDKPHEKRVLDFISRDPNIQSMMSAAGISMDIVKILILRTTYPWRGDIQEQAQLQIMSCFANYGPTRDDADMQNHYMDLGWYLSVVDRVGGYALGDFGSAMELAKMNAHALGWAPSVIVQRSVAYFEDLLNNEPGMCKTVMESLPRQFRKNFFDTVLAFMHLRSKEISIQANHTYDNLRFVPTIDTLDTRNDPEFIGSLLAIFAELPKPLQFGRDNFEESVRDQDVVLNTLRLNSCNGQVIGFAKGGPLENYQLGSEIDDVNYGLSNTVFLEPLALQMGYWGMGGGSMMRHLFVMQSYSKRYKYLTSFALRDVIQSRMDKEDAEFVAKFDPERWDYYRIRL